MDMTNEFLNGLLELDTPNTIEHGKCCYVDKSMNYLPADRTADPIATETLTSIVDYINANADIPALGTSGRYVIHVQEYNVVNLYTELNLDKKRDHLVYAKFDAPKFPFDRWMDTETFIVNLQSAFCSTDDQKTLLAFLASVKDDTSVTHDDNGVSQIVTAKSGISLAKNTRVPNPVTLCPYRTFPELGQPDSEFVFRMRKDGAGSISAALFEADGNAWKHAVIQAAKRYFIESLDGRYDVIILA